MSTTEGPIDPVLTGIVTVVSPILKEPVVALMEAAFSKVCWAEPSGKGAVGSGTGIRPGWS